VHELSSSGSLGESAADRPRLPLGDEARRNREARREHGLRLFERYAHLGAGLEQLALALARNIT
jgi:hypothetical protein